MSICKDEKSEFQNIEHGSPKRYIDQKSPGRNRGRIDSGGVFVLPSVCELMNVNWAS